MDLNAELAQLGIEIDVSLHLRMFALCFARVIGLCIPTPFLGGKLVPGRIKFGIPLFFTAFFYPLLNDTLDPARVPEIGLVYAGFMAKEIFVGYTIGFIVSLPFHAIEAAGSFMDTQRGTTFAQVISPATGGQSSLLGQFLNLLFMTIFLTIGGLQVVLEGLIHSYQVIPILTVPATLHPNAPAVVEIIKLTSEVFRICVQFAAPVVIAVFLTDVTLGIVNRTAPNIQVFFLGMPIKALGALVVLFVAFDFVHGYFASLIATLGIQIKLFLQAMAAT